MIFLSEPHFLHAIEYGNYVYFFFREIAVEHNNLGKASTRAGLPCALVLRGLEPGWFGPRVFLRIRCSAGGAARRVADRENNCCKRLNSGLDGTAASGLESFLFPVSAEGAGEAPRFNSLAVRGWFLVSVSEAGPEAGPRSVSGASLKAHVSLKYCQPLWTGLRHISFAT